MTKVQPVRFRLDELDSFRAAADAAGLNFNAWVRRACREAAALERAVDGLSERELSPVGAEGSRPRRLAGSGSRSERPFKPDFRPVKKR